MRATSSVIVGRGRRDTGAGRGPGERRERCRAGRVPRRRGRDRQVPAGGSALRAYDRDMPVLRGRATSTGLVVPFRPLAEALSSRFRAAGAPDDPELQPYRPALAGLVPEWRSAAAAPGYAISLVELAEALLRLLAVLGRERGCVILLEDLHDSDTETIAVVEYLVDNVAELPVLLVATLRPDPGPALDLALAAELRNTVTLRELGPLDGAAVRDMAAACLDAEPGEVPPAAHRHLAQWAGGNPYLVEVLLADLLDTGRLGRADGGWRFAEEGGATVPAGAVRSWARRLDRLDEPVRELLLVAATLGGRFSVGALRAVTGLDDRALFAHLRSASEVGIIAPDGAAHDHYAFRHALTADALRASLPPAEQAALARRAASAIEDSAGELAGDQRQLVGTLRLAAGDRVAASRQFAQVGRQMLDAGASGSAAVLLERARGLASDEERHEVTVQLAIAQAESGRLDEAAALLDDLPPVPAGSLAAELRAQAHTQVAWVATMAEQKEEARRRIRAARALLGAGPRPEQEAALAVVEGHLALLPERDGPSGKDGRERLEEAERSARCAALTAEQRGRPVVACQAWQLLAMLSRQRGFDEADACLERMLAVAEEHRLAVYRAEALVRLGTNAFMRTGEATRLETARAAARELGSLALLQAVDGFLAMQSVLGGRWDRAREITERSVEASARLQNLSTHRYLLLVDATLAAHQGRARDQDKALLRFRRAGGEESMLVPLQRGLCQAVGALMGEDRDRAKGRDRGRAGLGAGAPELLLPQRPLRGSAPCCGSSTARTTGRGAHGRRWPPPAASSPGTGCSSTWRTRSCAAATATPTARGAPWNGPAARRPCSRRRGTSPCGSPPRRRSPTPGANRSPGCGPPRSTSTTRAYRRWPEPAGPSCARRGSASRSAAAAASGSPPACAPPASPRASTRCSSCSRSAPATSRSRRACASRPARSRSTWRA
ncbi:LuxR family transcriptional regulator [Streptomyces sp. C]|nr:LuxR family transcriptional regulator [Streptomyces sp. C]